MRQLAADRRCASLLEAELSDQAGRTHLVVCRDRVRATQIATRRPFQRERRGISCTTPRRYRISIGRLDAGVHRMEA